MKHVLAVSFFLVATQVFASTGASPFVRDKPELLEEEAEVAPASNTFWTGYLLGFGGTLVGGFATYGAPLGGYEPLFAVAPGPAAGVGTTITVAIIGGMRTRSLSTAKKLFWGSLAGTATGAVFFSLLLAARVLQVNVS